MVKLLLIAPSFGAFGGMENCIVSLAKYTNNLDRFNVKIVLKKVKNFELKNDLVTALNLSGVRFYIVKPSSYELFKLIKNSDIIHCQNPSIDIIFIAKLLRKPVIVTVYNYRNSNLTLRNLLAYIACKICDRRFYISDFVWNTWESKKSKKSRKLVTIPELPLGIVPVKNRKGFVFVARWIPNKGLDILVEAYKRANINKKIWPLILLGDGPLRTRIEKKIKNEGIKGIKIKGFVSEKKRNYFIRHARWMVTPPNTREDLGLTPIEARNVKVPCIITKDGGLPEAGGQYSLQCNPGDVEGLKNLLERSTKMSEKEYYEICENTYGELQEYLKQSLISLHYEEYLNLLKKRKKAFI